MFDDFIGFYYAFALLDLAIDETWGDGTGVWTDNDQETASGAQAILVGNTLLSEQIQGVKKSECGTWMSEWNHVETSIFNHVLDHISRLSS